jgi:hypothetical protein
MSDSNSISAEQQQQQQQQREAVEAAWALSMQRAQARIAAGETPPEIRFDLLPQEQAQALMRCTHLLPPSMLSFSQAFPWLAFILQERFPEGNLGSPSTPPLLFSFSFLFSFSNIVIL